MDDRQLPPRPNLGQYKKQAKDLVRAIHAHDLETASRIRQFHPRCRKLTEAELFANPFTLSDAQLTIAREHGFESWPKFVKHVEALGHKESSISRFESAVEAIIGGDLMTLDKLLREDSLLARERSTREHRATLLHYVAANGIEGYRQKSPRNAASIANALIKAGAEVDAPLADGTTTTLGLVASSSKLGTIRRAGGFNRNAARCRCRNQRCCRRMRTLDVGDHKWLWCCRGSAGPPRCACG